MKVFDINILKVFLLLAAYSLALSGHAALDGEKLFESSCAVCHRKGGEGSIGLPLNKEKFRYFTDDYIVNTIRQGRPGRIMPAFDALSDSQVNAIVAYLRKWSGTPHREATEFTATGDKANGKKLFAGHCANCHGQAGKGLDKGTGQTYSRERDFKVIPPAISNTGFLQSVSDDMLREVISSGIKGAAMPAFAKMGMAEQNIHDIISYLRELESEQKKVKKEAEEIPAEPTLVVDSPYDFNTTVTNLKNALKGYNFRVFPDRYIELGLFPEWEVNKKQLTVRYCNFNELYDMLKVDPRVGIGLPCRIAVVENEKGEVKLIAMNMRLIAQFFNNAQLEKYAKEMSDRQMEILDEVTL